MHLGPGHLRLAGRRRRSNVLQRAGRRADDDDLALHVRRLEVPPVDIEEAQRRDGVRRPDEVDPRGVSGRGIDLVAELDLRRGDREGVEPIRSLEHVASHAVVVLDEVRVRRDRSAELESFAAAEDLGLGAWKDGRGRQHHFGGCGADREDQCVVRRLARAGLCELDVQRDHGRACLVQLADHLRVVLARERPRVALCVQRRVVDADHRDGVGSRLRAARVEAHVDGLEVESPQRVGGHQADAQHDADGGRAEEQKPTDAASAAVHAFPMSSATRNSDSTWNDWSTDEATLVLNPSTRFT